MMGSIYGILLVAGLVGLATLALLGLMHGSGSHGHSGHSIDVNLHGHGGGAHGMGAHAHAPAGPAPGAQPAHPLPVARGGHGAARGHGGHRVARGARAGRGAKGAREGASVAALFLPLLSPISWFSWAIGAGITGLALRTVVREPWTALAAAAGALLFNAAVIQPVVGLVESFASRPAENLEGCLLQTVEAVTGFNAQGEGLVRVTVDGRSEDILARLTDTELREGARVRRGDRLLIEEVDSQKNSCRVCRV